MRPHPPRRFDLCFLLLVLVLAPSVSAQRARAVRSAPLDTPAAWLRFRAIALDDATRLVRLTANARVVAFGDVTHGTHETYDARLRMIPPLVDEGGFRILAIEAPYAQWAALDAYVRIGIGDPVALLRNDPYFFWDTREMLDLLRWARARNASGLAPPIRIAGLDATEPIATGKLVVEKLRPLDAALASFAELEYGCLPNCNATLLGVRTRIAARRDLFATDADYDETVHAARVVEQGVQVAVNYPAGRDPAMAENVLWLAERGKVLMIGHNEHWSRLPYQLGTPPITFRSAGQDLHAALGNAYFVLASVVRDGTFHAVDALQRRVRAFDFDPILPDDWATVLDDVGTSGVVIPLFAPLPDWILVPRRMRFAGSAAPMQVTPAQALAAKFDAVLYIRTSTPTELLHVPVFGAQGAADQPVSSWHATPCALQCSASLLSL